MKNTCIIITEEILMRGTDFRSYKDECIKNKEEDGIDLIIATPLSNARMLQ